MTEKTTLEKLKEQSQPIMFKGIDMVILDYHATVSDLKADRDRLVERIYKKLKPAFEDQTGGALAELWEGIGRAVKEVLG